ncbi:AGAP006691-PA-like protein [Anopheles sinensis]|uniref:AGAP006691-PA-like protein n=1 Tax=Anopheles sinensis TaxID=74873 RepID=A0A084VGE1_ANOSI|nr:AGAP006691-PA-like protein [Anopheles sinensis]
MVDGIEMLKLAILAPRGAPVSISSMVLRPFTTGVWIVLLVLCLLSCLGHNVIPSLFQNNLFFLALFGFDKRNLRFTGRCEKQFAISMIILLFQLKCAYETILISYVIERPTEPDPRTIRDLKERNIPLLINDLGFDMEKFDFPLDGVHLEFGIPSELNRSAIVSFRYELELLAIDVANIDLTNGKPRFGFLEQTFPESFEEQCSRRDCNKSGERR